MPIAATIAAIAKPTIDAISILVIVVDMRT